MRNAKISNLVSDSSAIYTGTRGKRFLISLFTLVILITAIVLFFNQKAPADGLNFQAMESDVLVTVPENRDVIIFYPATRKANKVLVYYQGANVAPQSFAYGYPEQYPEIEHWTLAGFSLGGSSAAFDLANKESRFVALILYASYMDVKHSLRDKALKVLSLSGSNDGLATLSDIEEGKTLLPPDTQYLVIPGGNHTQFALYGNGKLQKGANKASLSAMEQQQMVIDVTIGFLLQGRQ